jgi:hypothetical protein
MPAAGGQQSRSSFSAIDLMDAAHPLGESRLLWKSMVQRAPSAAAAAIILQETTGVVLVSGFVVGR